MDSFSLFPYFCVSMLFKSLIKIKIQFESRFHYIDIKAYHCINIININKQTNKQTNKTNKEKLKEPQFVPENKITERSKLKIFINKNSF